MKRVLKFDGSTDESKSHFALLYQGFIAGGNMAERKGMETIRREGKILDKLEAISNFDNKDNQLPMLNDGEHELLLDPKEHELIQKYYESVNWLTQMSRQAVKTLDWFIAAPEQAENPVAPAAE